MGKLQTEGRSDPVHDQDVPEESSGERRELPEKAAKPRDVQRSPLDVYKPGRGVVVRWSTAAALGILSLWAASYLFEQLGRFAFADTLTVRYLIPVVVLVALGMGVFHLVGRNRRMVDFLIDTEGEMHKVNWSTRREVFGATRIVIVVMLGMGLFLFIVDLVFMAFFEAIGVLRVGMFSQFVSKLFSGGQE